VTLCFRVRQERGSAEVGGSLLCGSTLAQNAIENRAIDASALSGRDEGFEHGGFGYARVAVAVKGDREVNEQSLRSLRKLVGGLTKPWRCCALLPSCHYRGSLARGGVCSKRLESLREGHSRHVARC
jgi:hypothetical protein